MSKYEFSFDAVTLFFYDYIQLEIILDYNKRLLLIPVSFIF